MTKAWIHAYPRYPPMLKRLSLALALTLLSACASRSEVSKTNSSPRTRTPALDGDDDVPPWSAPISEPQAKHVTPRPRSPSPLNTQVELRYPRGSRPWLGVELQATDPSAPGVRINRVLLGSPAAAAKLEAGDVLLTMGETPVMAPSGVSRWVRSQTAGSRHPLRLQRASKSLLVQVSLEGTPAFEDRLRLAHVGRAAPEIAGVATFQGEASSLAELKGDVIILEFWASYCGGCRYLGPILDEWHRSYLPQGGHVIGITVDPPKLGLEVALRTGMHYTLASDPEAKISNKYLASQIPALFVIDRQGIVRDVMVGYSKQRLQETEALLRSLLKESP